MTQLWRSVQTLGFLLLSTLACSDRLPTEPAPTAAQGTMGPDSMFVAGPHRPATRVVAPRAAAAPQLQGRWGGDNVALVIGSNGTAVEFGCGAGSIDGPFVADSSGRFDLLGTWWFTPPVDLEGWQPEKRPARYSGFVEAGIMTLTVVRLDDGQSLGSFTLAFNQPSRIVHCV